MWEPVRQDWFLHLSGFSTSSRAGGSSRSALPGSLSCSVSGVRSPVSAEESRSCFFQKAALSVRLPPIRGLEGPFAADSRREGIGLVWLTFYSTERSCCHWPNQSMGSCTRAAQKWGAADHWF